jgi:hypothetical protein
MPTSANCTIGDLLGGHVRVADGGFDVGVVERLLNQLQVAGLADSATLVH